MFGSKRLLFLVILVTATLGCASSGVPTFDTLPSTSPAEATTSARSLVEESAAAHGGNVFEELQDLSVSYSGEWGFIASRIQPIVADHRYRTQSEERYLFADSLVFQKHTGKAGTKTVVRDPGSIEVFYGESEADEDHKAASALVADVYLMLISGPSYFLREGVELQALPADKIAGKPYDVVLARLEPGLGFSSEDRAQLWIDRETRLLHRVQFTLEGFRTTRGAQVDVTFHDHREIDGWIWPTRFVERIREPFDVFAHRWTLDGLDINRGLSAEDLRATTPTKSALKPAQPLDRTEISP